MKRRDFLKMLAAISAQASIPALANVERDMAGPLDSEVPDGWQKFGPIGDQLMIVWGTVRQAGYVDFPCAFTQPPITMNVFDPAQRTNLMYAQVTASGFFSREADGLYVAIGRFKG